MGCLLSYLTKDVGPTVNEIVPVMECPPSEMKVTSKLVAPSFAPSVTLKLQLSPLWVADVISVVSMLEASEQVMA